MISTPAIRFSMPMPIRFGGVPIGVPMPPIDAPNAQISIIAIANSRLPASAHGPAVRWATIDSPIGNIIAVVAVLLIHIEIAAVDAAEDDEDADRAAADQRATTAR